MVRDFICLVLVFSFVLSLFSLPVQAYVTSGVEKYNPGTLGEFGTPSSPGIPSYIESTKEYNQGDINLSGTVTSQLASTMNAITCLIFGCVGQTPGQAGNPQAGAVGILASSMGTMIANPPASGGRYVEYLAANIRVPGSPAPAYAANGAGIGYSGLSPVLPLWTLARNVAYIAFTLIFVVIGLMIIFRVKIDPKAVVTVQAALPKIFFALILITFSYAIVGFMIDLMYVLIGLTANLFTGVIDAGRLKYFREHLPSETIFGVFGANNFWQVTTGVSGAIGNIVHNIILRPESGIGGVLFQLGGYILGGAANALAWIIIAGAILIALFRTWWSLLGAYINIILGVISAPLFLMFEAIPGRGTFGIWLRQMLANILVFPFVTLLLLVGYALTSGFGATPSPTTPNNFVPPYLGGNDLNAITAIIGLGIILTLPRAINILQEVLKAPPFKYGTAWQEALKTPAEWAQFGGQTAVGTQLYTATGGGVIGSGITRVLYNIARQKKWTP